MAQAPPNQAMMMQNQANSGGGASAENAQAMCIGQVYNVVCCPYAVLGTGAQMSTVQQGNVGIVTRFGKYHRTLPPGRHRINVMAENVIPVSLKVNCIDVMPQEVMSADNLAIKIDAVCYFNVFDAQKAAFNVENYPYALGNLAQVTLRTVLGEHTLAEIQSQRQKLNDRLQVLIDEATDVWGIKVSRVEIKGIEIDRAMQRAMAAKAEAKQMAEAKIIQSQAQSDASSILADAAGKMEDNPASLKLQYFETLRIMATQGKTQNSTIIIPEGMDPSMAMAANSLRKR